jgi:hypothetical protein
MHPPTNNLKTSYSEIYRGGDNLARPRMHAKRQYLLRSEFLKMCYHKARRILVSNIVYRFFANKDGVALCFRCQEPVSPDDYHIDHKEPWMGLENGVELYFNISNTALSHPVCNSLARRQSSKRSVRDRVVNEVMNNRKTSSRAYYKKKQLKKD